MHTAFVYNSLMHRTDWHGKESFVFFFFLKIYSKSCTIRNAFSFFTFITQTMLWKWDGNSSRWTQSASTHIQIHTQACYKTSPLLIFTTVSVSLPLQNSITETCSIRGLRTWLRRSTKNMSALEVPFFSIPEHQTQCHFPPQFCFKLICRHIQLSAAP